MNLPALLSAAPTAPPRVTHDLTPFERFAENALFLCVDLGIILIVVGMVLCLWRLMKGPTLVDRGIAADTIALQVVGLVILITIRLSTLVDFDAVLIVAILGFVSTIAFAQFIGRRGRAA